jgi:hypothetical protein
MANVRSMDDFTHMLRFNTLTKYGVTLPITAVVSKQ